jgi:hypothetical protein
MKSKAGGVSARLVLKNVAEVQLGKLAGMASTASAPMPQNRSSNAPARSPRLAACLDVGPHGHLEQTDKDLADRLYHRHRLAKKDARHQTEAEGNENLRGKSGHTKAFARRFLGIAD